MPDLRGSILSFKESWSPERLLVLQAVLSRVYGSLLVQTREGHLLPFGPKGPTRLGRSGEGAIAPFPPLDTPMTLPILG